jgi:hypothetical protein
VGGDVVWFRDPATNPETLLMDSDRAEVWTQIARNQPTGLVPAAWRASAASAGQPGCSRRSPTAQVTPEGPSET